MKKKISILVIAAALSTAFCFSACNGDMIAASTEDRSPDTPVGSPTDALPKPGETFMGKKIGSTKIVPNSNDKNHGRIYYYDEDGKEICHADY